LTFVVTSLKKLFSGGSDGNEQLSENLRFVFRA